MQPDWTSLSEKALVMYRTFIESRQRQKPAFPFQNLPASTRLEYVLMDWDNYLTYLHLFQHDNNPFIEAQFRSKQALDEYAVEVLEYQYYSPKRSGCDWFLRLRETGEFVGVLNLYDLSKENKNPNEPRAAQIGYVVGSTHRRQGYALEACLHLLGCMPKLFKCTVALACTKPDNKPSMALLQKLGFAKTERGWRKELV